MSLKCNYCEYVYENQPISTMQLHLCADQEYHFINRLDLKEKPLTELRHELRIKKEKNVFSKGMLYY